MDEQEYANDNEEGVWGALSSLRGLADKSCASQGISAGEAETRQALLLMSKQRAKLRDSVFGDLVGRLSRLSVGSAELERCVDWLKKTGKFNDREIALVRQVHLFHETESGMFVVGTQRLSDERASVLLASLVFLGGLWVGWVLFADNEGLQQISNSFALGAVFGTVAQYAFNYSFGTRRIRDKILKIAPWFASANQA